LDLSLLKTWMPRHIGEPSGLAFGKPKDELHDAILRPAIAGHDEGSI
jgi:hypothetical protein